MKLGADETVVGRMTATLRTVLPWAAMVFGCSGEEGGLLTLEPAEVDFGGVPIGRLAEGRVAVTNLGPGGVEVLQFRPGARFDDGFSFEADFDGRLVAAGVTRSFDVRFAPTTVGSQVGSVVIDSDANPLELPLAGQGVTVSIAVDSDQLDFGNVVIDTTATVELRVTNESAVDTSISLHELTNARPCTDRTAADVFCIRSSEHPPGDTFELLAGGSTTLEVLFTPTVVDLTVEGQVVLRGCEDPECETQFSLRGRGVESGLRCDPPQLDFGVVPVGRCSTRTVSCANTANEQITIVSWSSDASTADSYSFEAPRVIVVNNQDSFGVDVTYCSTSTTTQTGALVIETDSAATRAVSVPLSGRAGGGSLVITPALLNFGLGTLLAPTRRPLLLTNVGFRPILISEILPDTLGTGAFSLTVPPGVNLADPLAPGASIEVTVNFQPVSAGPVQSVLVVRSSDPLEPEKRVDLAGFGVDLPPCQFEVLPLSLSFGSVRQGATLARSFEIRNTGTDDCLLSSARIEPGSDSEFTLTEAPFSVRFGPGESRSVGVRFAPTAAASFSGAAEFSISSPSSPVNRVAVNGMGSDAELLIAPAELDFGELALDCTADTQTVRIYNLGSAAVRFDSVTLQQSGSAFSLSGVPALPATVMNGASLSFDVSFRSGTQTDHAGAIEVQATVGGQPQTLFVSLAADTRQTPDAGDRFVQLGSRKADVLFLVDHSATMREELPAIANYMQSFLSFAQAQAIDYQVGVTTTDVLDEQGRLCPVDSSSADRIVTPSAVGGPESDLADNIQCRSLFTSGSFGRSGFESAFLALSPSLLSGPNAGFLRPDATLSLVFVSDGAEQSARPVDFYQDFMRSLKGHGRPNLVSVSAISGPADRSCVGAGTSATAAPRYVELVDRTGGLWREICGADYSQTMEAVGVNAFGFRTRFLLTNRPVELSIRVFVDGLFIPRLAADTVNWSYDSATNSLNFASFSAPEPGADVEVQYTIVCN